MEKAAATAQMPSELAPNSALVRACAELANRLSASGEIRAGDESKPSIGFVARLLGSLGAHA
jgi:Flp pilus assembly CpaE family ATPase